RRLCDGVSRARDRVRPREHGERCVARTGGEARLDGCRDPKRSPSGRQPSLVRNCPRHAVFRGYRSPQNCSAGGCAVSANAPPPPAPGRWLLRVRELPDALTMRTAAHRAAALERRLGALTPQLERSQAGSDEPNMDVTMRAGW